MSEKLRKQIKVAYVQDPFTVIINIGEIDGATKGQRFLVYSIGSEITDPDTKESLGKLEIVKGTGRITHIQEKIATLTSDMKFPGGKTVRRTPNSPISMFFSSSSEEYLPAEPKPFEDVCEGDLVKPI